VSVVVLIDDDPVVRKIAVGMLTAMGHDVHACSNVDDGISSFREKSPDFVLTDIVMPEKDGLEAIREILAIDPKAKLIAMSASEHSTSSIDYVILAKKMGAVSGLRKPFDEESLAGAIKEALAGCPA